MSIQKTLMCLLNLIKPVNIWAIIIVEYITWKNILNSSNLRVWFASYIWFASGLYPRSRLGVPTHFKIVAKF